MNKLEKKILSDLVFDAWVLIPSWLGLSSLIVSWGVNGGPVLNFIGISSLLAGVGLLATKFIYNVDTIAEKARESIKLQEEEERNKELDHLDKILVANRDPEDQELLRELRQIFNEFKKKVENQETITAITVFGDVKKIFDTCIAHLVKSNELMELSKTTKNVSSRKAILASRSDILKEVKDAIVVLLETVNEFHSKDVSVNSSDLSELTEELKLTMMAAKKTEKMFSSDKLYSEAEFE